MRTILTAFIGLLALSTLPAQADPPSSFEQAKEAARRHIYHDQNQGSEGTLYCGCDWSWTGRSGGRVDLPSCGYAVRAQHNRAQRLEWEHIVPAYVFGHQRRCWQNGGRENCKATDPVFSVMEADLHNLAPSIGEVNGDRSNHRYGVVAGTAVATYGACTTRVDFKSRVAEPRDEVKGFVARVSFYMHDRYDLSMSDAQQRLFMAWDKQYPVTVWERERDRRIAAQMGHSNPFVTGARQWTRGHRNHAEGIVTKIPEGHPALRPAPPAAPSAVPQTTSLAPSSAPVVGNANSKVYHLPQGCPSYAQVSRKNRIEFSTEAAAAAAGFRKAGNCR